MIQIIGEGIVAGVLVSISVGPIFFMLLDISINRGFRNALMYILGVFISDIIMVCILQAGLFETLQKTPLFKDNFYLIGGGLLFIAGIGRLAYLLITPTKPHTTETQIDSKRTYSSSLLQGFIVNSMTPTVFLFWLGMATLHSQRSYALVHNSLLIFYLTIIATVIVLDIVKASLATRLRALLDATMVKRLNLALAIIIMLLGGRMLLLGLNIL